MNLSRVLIVQRRLTGYRVPFFEALRAALPAAGFELRLAVGQGTESERLRDDAATLPWAMPLATRYALGDRLCWQGLAPALQDMDFVVLPQENKLIAQWPLLLRRQPFRVALWGHGTDLLAGPAGAPAQSFKRALLRRADWCFAYTERSARVMRRDQPDARIAVLQNSVDTAALRRDLAQARELDRRALRRLLGLHDGPLVLFLGSLYQDKRLDLVIDAMRRVLQQVPQAQLAIAGAGPLAPWVATQSAALGAAHLPGAVHGLDKARWLAAADLMLNPGLVGLGVLDAFVAELPLLGCDDPAQMPEFEYLQHGHNGWLVPRDAPALATAVLQLLNDAPLAARLREGCRRSAERLTLDAMVQHFVAGLVAWRSSRASARAPRA